MDFIITWSDGVGRVGTSEFLYDIIKKPSLNFPFDALYYETATNMYIKVYNKTQYTLSTAEKNMCEAYCKDFMNSDEYMIYAIDPDLKVFEGFMTRGQAKAAGLEEAVEARMPDHPMSKWDGKQWNRVVAAIDETGKLYLLPTQDNLKFNFMFTEKEWSSFVKPVYDDEIYDFATSTWKDNRNLESSKKLAEQKVRAYFLTDFNKYNLVNFEIDPVIYMIQLKEIMSSTTTPFISAMAKEMGIEEEAAKKRVENHYAEDLLTELGTLHGKMYKTIDSIRSSNTLEDLDAVMIPMFKDSSYPWRRPMRIDPYAPASEN